MLEGKTALITGASRGIGKAIALTFADNRAFVGINYHIDRKGAQLALKQIQKHGGDGILLQADVSNTKQVQDIVDTLVRKRTQIDILVNNAGIYKRGNFNDLSKNNWEKTLSINLTGCYNLCKNVIPHMQLKSKIIFISSQLAFKGSSHGADYATSKAGLLGFMKSLALEYAEKKINVNAIAPGTIDTELLADYTFQMKEKRINQIPLGRLGTPDDIANVCLFLASDLADYITGETIHVNGGLYIH